MLYLLWEAGGNAIEGGKEPHGNESDLLPDGQLFRELLQPTLGLRRERRWDGRGRGVWRR